MKDFRPTNLITSLYELLVKVLTVCLKKMVRKVVSCSLNELVEGRQILVALLIADKAIDSLLKRKINGLLCKPNSERHMTK